MELQEHPQRLAMRLRIRLVPEIELSYDSSPAQELASEVRIALDFDREIHERQRTFVAAAELEEPFRPQGMEGTLQLHGDLQDLLRETEAGPALRRQGGVLSHGRGLPRPSSAKITSRIFARIDTSWIWRPGFPALGRMLMIDSKTTQAPSS